MAGKKKRIIVGALKSDNLVSERNTKGNGREAIVKEIIKEKFPELKNTSPQIMPSKINEQKPRPRLKYHCEISEYNR